MRVDANNGKNLGVRRAERRRRGPLVFVVGDVHDRLDPGLACPRNHIVAIVIEGAVVEVGMRVDQRHTPTINSSPIPHNAPGSDTITASAVPRPVSPSIVAIVANVCSECMGVRRAPGRAVSGYAGDDYLAQEVHAHH